VSRVNNVFIVTLRSTGHGPDHMEDTSSSAFSIVACAYFGRCLEIGLHVTISSLTIQQFIKIVEFTDDCQIVWSLAAITRNLASLLGLLNAGRMLCYFITYVHNLIAIANDNAIFLNFIFCFNESVPSHVNY
jgi:hypothetical protein